MAFGGGHLYVADGLVREVSAHGWLTTPVGDLGELGGGIVNGSPASSANLVATDVAVAPNGDLVITDGQAQRVLVAAVTSGWFCGMKMTAGDIYILAGNGRQGYSGQGILARNAALNNPNGVTVDGAGNVVIPDTYNSRVRVVANKNGMFYGQPMTAGHIYNLAGDWTRGFHGDGGPAVKASLDMPNAAAVDSAGNVVIADTYNRRVRVVAATTGTFYGQAMTAGDIYSIAGNGTKTPKPGGPGTQSGLNSPQGVAVDHAGNVLIADTASRQVDVVAATTGTFYGQPMTAGYLYVLPILPVHLRSGGSVPDSKFAPLAVTVDSAGNVVIADRQYVAVFAAQTGSFYGWTMTVGNTYAVAGNGYYAFSGNNGPATQAQFNFPQDVAADGSGNVLIADAQNNRVRVVAASSGTFYGQVMTAGNVYNLAGTGSTTFNGDGGPATSANLNHPQAMALDHAGNVLIADSRHGRIRVVAASTGTIYGQAMTAGHIYTIAGGGNGGSGGPATQASLAGPNGVAVDGSGNLVIADTSNCAVYVVAASGGTLYGQPMTAGNIYKVAGTYSCVYSGDGGPGTSASVNFPYGVAVDAAGNIVVADTSNDRVRVVAGSTGTFYGQPMTTGYIYTVAGSGLGGALLVPTSVAVDGNGNVIIADAGHSLVQALAATSGTFYGVAMTARNLYPVAGDGTGGYSGDGGPAVSAELEHPQGVAVDGPNLVIADAANTARVRMVSG